MSVVEWIDTYDIHHWRIIWSIYRKLGRVGFEPKTTEFRSDALTDCSIGYENCFLSFIIFLISNCNFHLSVLFSYRSDVLFSWTVNQFIFQNICRWLLISFFQRTNDSGEWNMQRVSLWHIFSNWYRRTRKIRF